MKPCSRCERHVRVSEVVCPFCGSTQHEVSATARSWAVGLAMLGAACGPAKEDSASGSTHETTLEATSTSGGATTLAPTSSGSDSEAGTSTSTSTSTGGTSSSSTECASCSDSTEGGAFIYAAPDMGGGPLIQECDPWVQDCPPGQKCTPFSADGDSSPDSLHCAPVAESPEQAGDPCVLQGPPTEQTDNCDIGLYCWADNCAPLCSGSPDAPVCDDPAAGCLTGNQGVLLLCLPKCDPLAQDCPADETCLQADDTPEFLCVVDASDDGGHEFDSCDFLNGCDPGLVCLLSTLAAECDVQSSQCCLSFCDLTMPTCTGAGAECLPWFEAGMAPAGLEDVGVCRLPN